jgi:hypothetical protein
MSELKVSPCLIRSIRETGEHLCGTSCTSCLTSLESWSDARSSQRSFQHAFPKSATRLEALRSRFRIRAAGISPCWTVLGGLAIPSCRMRSILTKLHPAERLLSVQTEGLEGLHCTAMARGTRVVVCQRREGYTREPSLFSGPTVPKQSKLSLSLSLSLSLPISARLTHDQLTSLQSFRELRRPPES